MHRKPWDTVLMENDIFSLNSGISTAMTVTDVSGTPNAGKIDVKRLISKTFKFDDAIAAYEYAAAGHGDVVKVMIDLS
jgi:threonine dehydrogenase-like Zn-dependent dehydrogenase